MQDPEAGQEQTTDSRSRIPVPERLVPEWEMVCPLSAPPRTLTGSAQLSGASHCHVPTNLSHPLHLGPLAFLRKSRASHCPIPMKTCQAWLHGRSDARELFPLLNQVCKAEVLRLKRGVGEDPPLTPRSLGSTVRKCWTSRFLSALQPRNVMIRDPGSKTPPSLPSHDQSPIKPTLA